LASPETLESLSGLLEGGSINLTEKGEIKPVKKNPNFRLFACMNPPNDVGKRELPPGLRNRFSEIFVDEVENSEDLGVIVGCYLRDTIPNPPISEIVNFYLSSRELANSVLSDGANQRPRYSLRTLVRTLEFCRGNSGIFGFRRALYEGACMSFLTLLDGNSIPIMEKLIETHFVNSGGTGGAKLSTKLLNKAPQCPGTGYVKVDQFWIKQGTEEVIPDDKYIITPMVRAQLRNLCRVVLTRKYPALLQGPTSSGMRSKILTLPSLSSFFGLPS
jgi:midasin